MQWLKKLFGKESSADIVVNVNDIKPRTKGEQPRIGSFKDQLVLVLFVGWYCKGAPGATLVLAILKFDSYY